MSEKGKAAVFLALLSPMIAELLSGSSPPFEFFTPFGLTVLIAMYGAGALLVREFVVIWKKGWASTIILGAAYGIAEEGIAVKSFFDPNWIDLDKLGEYGRFLDVNWVWAFWLTIYHSMISVCLPILIIALWYPHLRGERLLNGPKLKIVGAIFLLDIAACAVLFVYVQDYVPPAGVYMLCILAVLLLVLLAKVVPAELIGPRHDLPSWRPWKFFALGFAMLTGTFVVAGSAFEAVHPVIPILLMLLFSAAALMLLQHKLGSRSNSVHKACFASGLMLLLILLSPLHEVGGMTGMSVVGLCFTVFCVILIRRAGRSQ